MTGREVQVDFKTPMPRGYSFLKKGNPYMTGLCRRTTLAADQVLYKVMKKNVSIGVRAPKRIVKWVRSEEQKTRAERQAAVAKHDSNTQSIFKAVILKRYPKIPTEDLEKILKHTLQKRSGRVGRTGKLQADAKARFAVTAHIRHKHTAYETLLKEKLPRSEARGRVHSEVLRIAQQWQSEAWGVSQKRQKQKQKQKLGKQTQQGGTSAQVPSANLQVHQGPLKRRNGKNGKLQASENPYPTRSARSRGKDNLELETLEDFFNDEDHPIVIDSTDDDETDWEGEDDEYVEEMDELNQNDLDEYSDAVIVLGSDDESDLD